MNLRKKGRAFYYPTAGEMLQKTNLNTEEEERKKKHEQGVL